MRQKQTSAVEMQRWVPVANGSGEEVPPFAVLRITGVGDDGIYTVAKPNADNATTMLLFNGPSKIPASKYGTATPGTPAHIAFDSGDGTPGAGDEWGVASGQWKLKNAQTGFLILGQVDSVNGVVVSENVGTASGGAVIPGYIRASGGYSFTPIDDWAEDANGYHLIGQTGLYYLYTHFVVALKAKVSGTGGLLYDRTEVSARFRSTAGLFQDSGLLTSDPVPVAWIDEVPDTDPFPQLQYRFSFNMAGVLYLRQEDLDDVAPLNPQVFVQAMVTEGWEPDLKMVSSTNLFSFSIPYTTFSPLH